MGGISTLPGASNSSAVFRYDIDSKIFYNEASLKKPVSNAIAFSIGDVVVVAADTIEITDTTTGRKWQTPANVSLTRGVTWAVVGDTMYWTWKDLKWVQTIQIKRPSEYICWV